MNLDKPLLPGSSSGSSHNNLKFHEAEFSIAAMCRVLDLNPSGYYEVVSLSRIAIW